MLSKDRQEVYDAIRLKLQDDMNNLQDFYGMQDDDQEWFNNQYTDNMNFSLPDSAKGWPPGLAKYIRRVALMLAYEILDNIYTEEDMERKAEDILFDRDDT